MSVQGGLCLGEVSVQGDPPCTVKSGRHESYWNAFLMMWFFRKFGKIVSWRPPLLRVGATMENPGSAPGKTCGKIGSTSHGLLMYPAEVIESVFSST